ncbi:MAG: KOW domain-containing protein [Peptoniphilaceae bacterium]
MDKTFTIKVGLVVKSMAGRDAGEVFLINKVIDESFVYIVNGKTRKLANPKKKKIKHLALYKDCIDLNVENLNDAYIRKALNNYS